ncbi:cbb3-type cytochrome oxidase assembly protein CcoS [Olivibacter sp. SDN3]|uniref:cbb3-type cytochrome oxidase assembly protein CcoS n=1 Tax=Olivibacter sp. SDN3 TaxID=2764720 RepID=UPI001650DF4C|nr:cbb3-type cytochrome oxidase assembly protein CcoS [Olivibacter sp. SDN3]QNL48693.1 cbb3-type cytochrome oxidase assembly protein CcoS [Olivibacter sp. SDN3]
MSAIYFLIGCSVIIALIFLIAFFWANKDGQHDDTYTPAIRILFDDELKDADTTTTTETTNNHSG